jgi:hypothetical protein
MKTLATFTIFAWAAYWGYCLTTESKPVKVAQLDNRSHVVCDCCLPAIEPDIECFTRQQAWNSVTAQYRQDK